MKVYLAGPISKGDQFQNVARAIEAGELLFKHGHIPFIPHLTAFWHMMFPHSWSEWLRYDEYWVHLCDALVVLPGYSEGAELEVSCALSKGIPVFYSVEQFLEKMKHV